MTEDTKETEMAFLGCVGGFVLAAVTVVYPVLLGGVAFRIMWGWFVVPLFQLPALSLAAACGIDMTFTVLRGAPADRDKTEAEQARGTWGNICYRLIYLTCFYALAVGIGYVIKAVWL